jgi:two-component system, cell cycle sensor histidine kinase and response regulator CckA
LPRPFPPLGVTILVVDDERISRRVAYRILSEEGYRVFEADGHEEALDALSQSAGRIDLMLVDAVMPRCDGVTLARLAQEQWPKIKILYMSAHPAEILAQQGLSALDVLFLAKPYTRDELLGRVREALDRRSRKRITSERKKSED